MKIKVAVKQEHIDQGKKRSATSCPIALALIEQYPSMFQKNIVCVGGGSVWNRGYQRGKLPIVALDFIRDFDDQNELHTKVFPFEFQIKI